MMKQFTALNFVNILSRNREFHVLENWPLYILELGLGSWGRFFERLLELKYYTSSKGS